MRRLKNWIRIFLSLSPLALAACADVLQHQRQIAAMHSAVAAECRAKPARCAPLADCAADLRRALGAWQRVSEATVAGDLEGAELASADALISEGGARAVCALARQGQGVK